jgi:RNA polymerase sigma factor (sigma-70 family)
VVPDRAVLDERGPDLPAHGSLDEVVTRFAGPALALARRILRDDGLAEDVVQDVFLAVWRNPDAFDAGRGRFASWLMAMVHHKAVDAVRRESAHLRRLARSDAVPGSASGTDAADVACDLVRRTGVRAALASLRVDQREVLVLAYFGGYTQQQIATLTGTPLGTVKARTAAGLRALRGRLEPLAAPAWSMDRVATGPVDAARRVPLPRRAGRPRPGRPLTAVQVAGTGSLTAAC